MVIETKKKNNREGLNSQGQGEAYNFRKVKEILRKAWKILTEFLVLSIQGRKVRKQAKQITG